MVYRLGIKAKFKQLHLHAERNGALWASSGYDLYLSRDRGENWAKIARFPRRRFSPLAERFAFLRRFLRLRIRTIIPLSDDLLLVVGEKRIFRFLLDENRFEEVYQFEHGQPTVHGFCLDHRQHIYFGEYWLNPNREEIKIYKSADQGATWWPVCSFPKRSIRHIHSVQYDHFSGQLWICTGDKDYESQIAYSQDGGKTFIPIGKGSQQWRTTRLIFTEKYIYWGTDAPDEQNHIYRWQRAQGLRMKLHAIEGPVHCETGLSDGTVLVATGVEKGWGKWDPIRIMERILRVPDQEIGAAEKDSFVHVWASRDGERWHELARWKKDWLPARLFGYGIVHFVHEGTKDNFYFSASGLKDIGGYACRARIEEK